MREILINGRWPLILPDHRADRPEWPWWEATRMAAMRYHLGPGDVVYDIGAEEGDLPALWATWGCQVFMVEPNPRVWANIRAVWDANGLSPLGWFCGFAAADDHDTEQGRPVNGQTWPAAAYGPLIGDHGFLNLCERPEVPRVRIDTISDLLVPPTAVTIDVEGAELAVLQGAAGVLDHHRPKVWVSIHPQFSIDMYGVTKADCLQFMADHGYDATYLGTDHEEHWMFLPHP